MNCGKKIRAENFVRSLKKLSDNRLYRQFESYKIKFLFCFYAYPRQFLLCVLRSLELYFLFVHQ